MRSSISRLLACSRIARDSVVGAGSLSITRIGTPRRASSHAITRPTGPAPTTSTSSPRGARFGTAAAVVGMPSWTRSQPISLGITSAAFDMAQCPVPGINSTVTPGRPWKTRVSSAGTK